MSAPHNDSKRAAGSSSAPNPNSNIATPAGQAGDKVNPKNMTKAQRREMQESQRAAKAAAAAQGGAKGKNIAKPGGQGGGGQSTPGKPRRPTESGDTPSRATFATSRGAGRDARDSTHGEEAGVPERGLRIFSHFGLPKAPSNVKGDIHPAIVRLGLQFSGFKITGANARCIATLTAFKTVCASCIYNVYQN